MRGNGSMRSSCVRSKGGRLKEFADAIWSPPFPYYRKACCILPPYHPLTHNWSQNALLFPPLLSHSLSWTLNMEKGFYITKLLNILETIRGYIYICFLGIYRTVSL